MLTDGKETPQMHLAGLETICNRALQKETIAIAASAVVDSVHI